MKKAVALVAVIALALLAAWYFSVRQDQEALEQVEVTPAQPDPEPIEVVQYPVEDITPPRPQAGEVEPPPELPPEEPLPTLGGSDEEVRERAAELGGEQGLTDMLVADFLLARLVATIDSLDTRRVAPPQRPLKPVPGRFTVLESGDQAVISPENAERYTPYVELIAAMDTDQLVSAYLRYYPLLQEAYNGMGYQDAYFNDRAVEILDLLLATPEPRGLIEVTRNEAVWEFTDPELESLAVGQKALLRLSEEDRRTVKARLRELRGALAGAGPALLGED